MRPERANPNANLDTIHKWISNGASGVQLKRERSSQGLAGCMAQKEDWETLDLIFFTFFSLFFLFTSISHQENVAHDKESAVELSWMPSFLSNPIEFTRSTFSPLFCFPFLHKHWNFCCWFFLVLRNHHWRRRCHHLQRMLRLSSIDVFWVLQNIEIFFTSFFPLLFNRHTTIEMSKNFSLIHRNSKQTSFSSLKKTKKLEFKVSKKVSVVPEKNIAITARHHRHRLFVFSLFAISP